jgi:hypothetical protein
MIGVFLLSEHRRTSCVEATGRTNFSLSAEVRQAKAYPTPYIPMVGVEPTWAIAHRSLSAVRLPVPPHRSIDFEF